MKIAVVTTLYHSAPYLEEFYTRIKATLARMELNHEIVLVNDGSPDNSLDIALALMERDSAVKVIDLSRNFGHHRAILTGLCHASGDLIFLIDCDLEEDPELFETFFVEWQHYKEQVDVIYGVQKQREGGWFRCWAGGTFYWLFNLLSGEIIPRNISMTRLMSRRYVHNLLLHKDRNVFLAGLFQLTGFQQKPLFVEKRYKGNSTYHLGRKLAMAINGITSFSSRPLMLIGMFGLLVSIAACLYTCLLVYRKFVHGVHIDGWTSLMVSIWFLSGVTIFSIGVVGLYVAKIFLETKRRPVTIIRGLYQRGGADKQG